MNFSFSTVLVYSISIDRDYYFCVKGYRAYGGIMFNVYFTVLLMCLLKLQNLKG